LNNKVRLCQRLGIAQSVTLLLFLVAAFIFIAPARAEDFQGASHQLKYEDGPVGYNTATPTDAIARLQKRLESGETKLPYDDKFGYLPALLKELGIPASSQMLVFSKTSLQRRHISPENPRALYFNDDVYVGYIPGAPVLEISTADAKMGGVFYHLENDKAERPVFNRGQDCLNCHGGQRTLGVPGHFVRSVETDAAGELKSQGEFKDIDQCAPLANRWAGWFVTGQLGNQSHQGNQIDGSKSPGNIDSLHQFFDVKKHLLPTSDVTALMVLEHQAKMHNYITRLNFETQIMVGMYGHIRYLRTQVNAFLRYLLFAEEAPLTAPIVGRADYAKSFQAQGPFDRQHRSLRDLDLKTRLFKYPCSYLIYSEQFDAIPAVMRDHILERLHAILTGQDQDPQFARLDAPSRQAILEILLETKPNLPACWRAPNK
jgi:hypothetical protein